MGETTTTEALSDAPVMHEMPAEVSDAIAAVMSEAGAIAKSGWNSEHKFKFATVSDVMYAVQRLMAQNKLVIVQHEAGLRWRENAIFATYYFTLHCKGRSWLSPVRTTGMARYSFQKGGFDDKALSKAKTAAHKYYIMHLFMIPALDEKDERLFDGDSDEDGPDNTSSAPAGSMRHYAETQVAGRANGGRTTDRGASDEKPPQATRDAIPFYMLDGSWVVCRKSRDGTAIDLWMDAWADALSKVKNSEDLRLWSSDNEDYLSFVEQNWPQAASHAKLLREKKQGRFDGFPLDTANANAEASAGA